LKELTLPTLLKRHPESPVLRPNPFVPWEALNVFNPGVVYHNGLFHMFYRAQGIDFTSSIGYAVSADGLHFAKLDKPVFAPSSREDYRGVEDARITPMDGQFYMCYTAYGDNSYYPMIAKSTNLITWEKVAAVERAENKDHVLFPEKIKGRYVIFHRRPPSIWVAYSDDLHTWTDHTTVMSPRADNGWDEKRVGAGGVPIKTDKGWLILYHAYNNAHIYRLSAALLDYDDPSKVIHRPKDFLIEPRETWELKGDVANVIFSAANPVVDGTVYVYYGGADKMVGLATIPLAELLDFAENG